MIAGLKPYPAMKDSGVAWLGQVPEHWEAVAVVKNPEPLSRPLGQKPITPFAPAMDPKPAA